jgi:putative ABC transport system permease protein
VIADIRYALRTLRTRPGFSAVAILTLALGIGANSAIFTVVNAVLLRPLPFRDADRLVVLAEHTGATPTITTSWQNYQDWRDQTKSYDGFGAVRSLTMTLADGAEPERLPAKMVSASLLAALGTAPALGRGVGADDDRPGAAAVAVLSDALWRRRFGASPEAIGRAVTLDGRSYTIVGVMPASFRVLAQADVYLPMGPWAATLPDDRNWHPGLWPIARLKPDVTVQQAQAEMDVISARLEKQYPEFNHGVTAEVQGLHDYAVQNIRPSVLVLAGAVGFVLLIACANVANLLLARAVGRRKEIAIRTAIGASRTRIASQLVVECVVLALAGGGVGMALAFWSVPLLAALAGAGAPGAGPIALDTSVLVFTIGVSIATGLLFGLAPAVQTARVNVSAAINEGGRGVPTGAGHHRLRGALVIAEMALATMLLVGAVLLARSLLRLQDVPTGFNAAGVLLADAPLSPAVYGAQSSRNQLIDRLLPRLRALPGVLRAEIATAPPFAGNGTSLHFNIAGRPPKGPEEFVVTGYRAVTDGYFTALGIPLRTGRLFTDRDREGSKPVAIVNETFVRRHFHGNPAEALAARAQIGGMPGDETPWLDLVGIVGDTKQAFENTTQPTMFVPYRQNPIELLAPMYLNPTLILKTSGDAAALAGGLRAAMLEVDRDQPLARVRTMEDAMAESVTQPRLQTMLLTLLSGVALALSLVGVYGVMAYAVGERTHEIGVRIALGAAPGDIRALVVGEGSKLAGIGIALGMLGALAASRVLGALLFGISATDPATFIASAAGLGSAALLAAYGPARRAGRIDPVVLLR